MLLCSSRQRCRRSSPATFYAPMEGRYERLGLGRIADQTRRYGSSYQQVSDAVRQMRHLHATKYPWRQVRLAPTWVITGLSMIEIIAALYFGVLRYDVQNPRWELRDRFILSKGHGALAYYAAISLAGFIHEKDLATFKSNDVSDRASSHGLGTGHRILERKPGPGTLSGRRNCASAPEPRKRDFSRLCPGGRWRTQ